MKYHYVFESESILDFKYCPYCGKEIMEVYPGDYGGFIQCWECEEAYEKLEFSILQEMINRFPNEWKKVYSIKEG